MPYRPRPALFGLALVALVLAGCAGTRSLSMGVLPNGERLVTLVVSEDRQIVEQHCHAAIAIGPIYGCQMTRPTTLPDGETVKLIKIVRYTDALPSLLAFEIDIHELCHAAASLQSIQDPCHVGNDGELSAAPRALIRPSGR